MTIKPHFYQMSECITKWLDDREYLTFVEFCSSTGKQITGISSAPGQAFIVK